MAERRMFAKTIIDSDVFLDMPLSAQALYFHLSMRADDDGFVNNPKKIQRMVGASDDDSKLLILKQFIIAFESGVIVIKHWKIHNYIQKDRYKPTVYEGEKASLSQNENGVYTECIQNVSNSDTQVRLGKDRLDKSNLHIRASEPVKYKEIVDVYNHVCEDLPKVKLISDARKTAIKNAKTVLDKAGMDFTSLFEKVQRSDFLCGRHSGAGRNWRASFDWILKKSNLTKIIEDTYQNQNNKCCKYYTVDDVGKMCSEDDVPF